MQAKIRISPAGAGKIKLTCYNSSGGSTTKTSSSTSYSTYTFTDLASSSPFSVTTEANDDYDFERKYRITS